MLTSGLRPARATTIALVLVAAATTGCRAGDGNGRVAAGGGRVTTTAAPAGEGDQKVAPRWERVARVTGTGDGRSDGFEIAADALQWRVTAACDDRGAVRVALAGEAAALAEVPDCPGTTFGFSIRTGPAALDVEATGAWEVLVDQQLDTPVAEPALAGMTAAARLGSGQFYGIDQKGSGTAALYRLPGGTGALRFDPFLVTRNSDLFVWVSEAPAPHTSAEALHRDHVEVARLTATGGAQNYVLPDTVDPERVRSVVVWCEPVRTAYAAASLGP